MADELAVKDVLSNFALAAQRMGQAMSVIQDEQVPAAIAVLRRLAGGLEENTERLRERALLYLNVHGQQVTEKGTVEAKVGGYTLRAVPMRNGVDPRKLEAALRAKKLNPADWMIPTITFKLDQFRLSKLMVAGHLTEEDLKAIQYDKTYRIETTQGTGGSNE
jgi:hypothetical protein